MRPHFGLVCLLFSVLAGCTPPQGHYVYEPATREYGTVLDVRARAGNIQVETDSTQLGTELRQTALSGFTSAMYGVTGIATGAARAGAVSVASNITSIEQAQALEYVIQKDSGAVVTIPQIISNTDYIFARGQRAMIVTSNGQVQVIPPVGE